MNLGFPDEVRRLDVGLEVNSSSRIFLYIGVIIIVESGEYGNSDSRNVGSESEQIVDMVGDSSSKAASASMLPPEITIKNNFNYIPCSTNTSIFFKTISNFYL